MSADSRADRRPRPPTSVRTAFAIYLITALISLVAIVVVLTGNVYDKAIMEAANQGVGFGVTAQQIIDIATTVAAVAGALFLLLYVFLAFKMRSGRNWARITLAVVSGLAILTVAGTGSVKVNNRVYSSTMSLISGWVGAALAVLALVFMFVAASNRYFRPTRATSRLPD